MNHRTTTRLLKRVVQLLHPFTEKELPSQTPPDGEDAVRLLHNRLEYGLSELSGLQQGEPDPNGGIREGIRDVVRDIAAALTGYEIEFTRELPHQ